MQYIYNNNTIKRGKEKKERERENLAAVIQSHRLGGIDSRHLYFSGRWKFEVRVPVWSDSSENFLPGLLHSKPSDGGERASSGLLLYL